MIFKVAISDEGSIYKWNFREFTTPLWQESPASAIDQTLALKKKNNYVDYEISDELLRHITNLADIWALTHDDFAAKQVQLKNELTTLISESERFPDPSRPPLNPKLVATRIKQIRKELDRLNKEIAAEGLPSRSCGHPPPEVEDVVLIPVGCRTIFEDAWRLCAGKDQLDIDPREINSRGNWRTRQGELCNPHETADCYNVCIADPLKRICESREQKEEKDQEALLLDILQLPAPRSDALPTLRKPSKSPLSTTPLSKSPLSKITPLLPKSSQTSQVPKSLSGRTEEEELADLLGDF